MRCGEPFDEPYAFRRVWRLRFSAVSALSGTASLLAALAIRLSHGRTDSAFGKWVNSWYNAPVNHHSRRSYGTYVTLLGDDWVGTLCIAGGILLIFGALLFLKVPMNSSRSNLWSNRT